MVGQPYSRSTCSSPCCGEQHKQINTSDTGVPQTSDQGQTANRRSTEKPQEEHPNKPNCCKDKPSPCCDVSCLDRIALRECHKEQVLSSTEAAPKVSTLSCQSPDGRPCDQHRRSARTKYLATLEALGCICRALIALGQESCCVPLARSSLGQNRRSTDSFCAKGSPGSQKCRNVSVETGGESCSSGCCSPPKAPIVVEQCSSTSKEKAVISGSCCSKSETSEFARSHTSITKGEFSNITTDSKGHCGESKVYPSSSAERCSSPENGIPGTGECSSGCCSKRKTTPCALDGGKVNKPACSSRCCSKPDGPSDFLPVANADRSGPVTCSTGCCGKPVTSPCTMTEETSGDLIEAIPAAATPDLEKGMTGKEHVVLSISGMTCTGCETKLTRTLGTLQSVQNLKSSLVLSRAEFDLDVGIQSLDEVLKYLERTTEFKYERVTDRGSRVDVIVPNASEFMKHDWPRGVTEMTLIDDGTVNVAFDAKITGARDLVEHGWGRTLSLAAPLPDPTLQAGIRHVRHMGYMTILPIILTVPVLVMAWAPLPEKETAYSSASLALATVVQVVIAGPFYPKALKALVFSRIIEMDLLIVLSTSAAYIFSVVSFGYAIAGQRLSTGEFFETSTLLVTLIMAGRYVAALARQKAVESISLRSLQKPTAILTDSFGSSEKEIDVRLLQYGDIFKVFPDSHIPTDGTVIGGLSEVDESMITGESIPVDKSLGSAVVAGSMVDQAKMSKANIQDIADRVASYFVPVVVALTIITFVIWIAVGITVRSQSGSRATTEAITYAITVLIVSCPCAIGLAVPMVIVISSGVAAERGIIFKSADSIELAFKTSHVVFDKTGTLTQGKLTVAIEHIHTTRDSMSLLLGLVGSNKHPISAAVTAYLKAKGISASPVSDTKLLTGKGVEGSAPEVILRAGNSRWLNLSSHPQVQSVLERGYTAFCFTINDKLAAVFGLEDSLRPDALETITKLQERGVSVHLLSGDDDGAVQSVARQLGIAAENIRSRCTPASKQAYIQALLTPVDQPAPRRSPTTIFIGDGTNDAIALATSTIGVHMNHETGTDVAKSAADVVLMRPTLLSILTMINISEKAVRRIKFNFGWSFVYNLFAILLGAGAFVDARIPPEFAGLGELVSVLPVVLAAVLLKWARV
ncbi:putative copper-transporting ATPase [Aspergillus nomiae NRRL 13137]|uniref:Putative copper-transporting ATPase n=1 Tax=Aspergillus nomiae NRRL (strain ATCC 15546 / NRRL 13137 / CBS 260.88 / M93) TaxID=1509407 RepID=A0A0L1J6T7_ASPN3|nr:putative copper-transporting ATPase [Aspergillus nomiae NRRL 13137]KNG87447.1 putative copper-transporting ATPase [Aspergillus nomiae NRRL 13137]